MYHFRLQRTDGSPADPPTYRSSVLTWRQGDTIPLGGGRTLRVLGVRDDDADQPPVLVVEDLPADPALVADCDAAGSVVHREKTGSRALPGCTTRCVFVAALIKCGPIGRATWLPGFCVS
jgi:hypothetical protein